jgi:hypothetical protein
MPRYLVYDTGTGNVVHTHETVDAISGQSLPCTREEVLALLGEVEDAQLDVIEEGPESRSVGHALRVDTKTKAVSVQAQESTE